MSSPNDLLKKMVLITVLLTNGALQMSSLSDFRNAVNAGQKNIKENASQAQNDKVQQQADALTVDPVTTTQLPAEGGKVSAPRDPFTPSPPTHSDYNSNNITDASYGHAEISLQDVSMSGADKQMGDIALSMTATMLGSKEITYDSNEENPILWNQALSNELVAACGDSLKDPASCFEGLKTAMSDPKNTLGQTQSSKNNAELFTYGRTPEEIKSIQKYLGLSADGVVGPATKNGLAAHRAVYGEAKLSQGFPRRNVKPTVDAMYANFTADGGPEGGSIHDAGDGRVTLMGGVVPDSGVTYGGLTVVNGKWSVPKGQVFDPAFVNTDNAVKKVNGINIRRSAYKTDEAFVRGVLENFALSARQQVEKAGIRWETDEDGEGLPQNIKQTIISLGWNMGEGFYKSAKGKAAFEQLTKETKDQGVLHKAFLGTVTQVGGGAMTSLAKRRANEWNDVHTELGGTKIVKVSADNSSGYAGNTVMKYYDKDNNVVFTLPTNRSTRLFGNKYETQKLNSNGVWVNDTTSKYVRPSNNEVKASLRPKLRPFKKS